MASSMIESVLQEKRVFPPAAAFAKQANISGMDAYRKMAAEFERDFEGAWARLARETLQWSKPFTQVLDQSKAPFFRWYHDGELNASYNCLDRHLTTQPDKTAIIFEADDGTITREEATITLLADDNTKLRQMQELVKGYFVRRKLDPRAIEWKDEEAAAGNMVRQLAIVKQGVDREIAKDVIKAIKDAKLKVQAAIQGDELRVSGKKRDDLQAAIALVKTLKIEQPLQFVNFRE